MAFAVRMTARLALVALLACSTAVVSAPLVTAATGQAQGGRIAYAARTTTDPNGDVRVDVHSVRPDGGDDQIVASGTDSEYGTGEMPAWSPDGTQIAIVLNGQVVVGNADGSGQRVVDQVQQAGNGGYPTVSWSPDGVWLVYGDGQRIVLLRPDGTDRRTIPVPLTPNPSNPFKATSVVGAWMSPNEDAVLYRTENAHFDYTLPYWARIDVDGRGYQQLFAPYEGDEVSWSPDGTMLLYRGPVPPLRRMSCVCVRSADGGPGRALFADPQGYEIADLRWSPGGDAVAVSYADGGLSMVNADGSDRRDVTSSRAGVVGWSPDGGRIAFLNVTGQTSSLLETVDADGTSETVTARGNIRSFAYGPGVARRAVGPTRVETAVSLSQQTFTAGATPAVVIARSDGYADALAGAPLAGKQHVPLLLSTPTELPGVVADEVRRLGATTAYLLGDTTALSSAVEAGLRDAGVRDLRRLGGATRYETAEAIAHEVGGHDVYIAKGNDPDPSRAWADAVAIAGLAAGQNRPILLTERDALPAATGRAMRDLGASSAAIVGGAAAVGTAVEDAIRDSGVTVERIAGADRYATSAAVADRAVASGFGAGQVWAATGRNWPDALGAGPTVGARHGILVLVDRDSLAGSPATRDWLAAHAADLASVTLVGGPDVVRPTVGREIDELAS